MTFQYRPRAVTTKGDRKMYAPHRDLAHTGAGLLRPVAISLDPEWHEPWFKNYLELTGVTQDELINGVTLLMQGVSKVIDTKDPPTAMAAVQFDKLSPELQAAIYARVGQVFLAALWEGIKDVSAPDSAPPPEIEDVYRAVEDLVLAKRQRETLWGRISSGISSIFGRFRTRT